MPSTDTLKTIVIDDAVPYAKAMFSHLGNVQLIPGRDIQNSDLTNAHALIVRSRTQVNKELLDNTSIEFVGSTVVGLDHIDQTYLQQHNIHFYSAQGCNANSVAEYIINNLVRLSEKYQFHLTDKSLGIIGVGNVGSRVLKKAKALGMTCLLNDPPKVAQQPELASRYTDLETCLQADIITVHTPLTKSGDYPTVNLINATRIQSLQPEQILINAARGGIIDEQAWSNQPLLANVIDCWENEPYIDETLYQQAELATPHIAGHSLDAKIAGSEMVYTALCDFWKATEQSEWTKQLPEAPNQLKKPNASSLQSTLHDILQQTYQPQQDDAAIRGNTLQETHKKYEFFRRNYPVHREWHRHTLPETLDAKLLEKLIAIGFKRH